MKNADITDPIFMEAVDAIDAGNLVLLQHLLDVDPLLVSKRINFADDGYFSHPYLLWFIANNPIRHDKLAANIVQVTALLIKAIKVAAPETLLQQINYTLGLVATGRIPREAGLQIELMDVLIDAGALPANALGALANNNMEAAQHLIKKGEILTLPVAVCFEQADDCKRLIKNSSDKEKQLALVAAAFYGKTNMIQFLIDHKTGINEYPDAETSHGFHHHATALHQAVSSGSFECVKLLVNAGASLSAKDLIYDGTPIEWADYLQREENDAMMKSKYAAIEEYLQSLQS